MFDGIVTVVAQSICRERKNGFVKSMKDSVGQKTVRRVSITKLVLQTSKILLSVIRDLSKDITIFSVLPAYLYLYIKDDFDCL